MDTWVVSSHDVYLLLFIVSLPQLECKFHRSRDLSDLFPVVRPAPSSGPVSQQAFTRDLWEELIMQRSVLSLHSSLSLALRGGKGW